MRWLWRKVKGLIRFFFGGVEANSAPQEKQDGVETPGALGSAKQKLRRVWTWLTSILNVILLPDKIKVALEKLKAAGVWAKTNWKSATLWVHHPKFLFAKLHTWASSIWCAWVGWFGKAAACVATPTVIAAIVVLVILLFVVMSGHPPTA